MGGGSWGCVGKFLRRACVALEICCARQVLYVLAICIFIGNGVIKLSGYLILNSFNFHAPLMRWQTFFSLYLLITAQLFLC